MQEILELANPKGNEWLFKIINFPDGQQDISILPDCWDTSGVLIRSRFNSFRDLELIICATQALRRVGVKNVSLFVPYLLGARCDRKFQSGGTSYLRDVVAPIINSQKYYAVRVYDVHNMAVTDACIDNLILEDNANLVRYSIEGIRSANFVIITPDEGASKKIYPLINKIGIQSEVHICSKKRDPKSGAIIESSIGNVVDFKGADIFIIDDICDGGRTFIEIAKKIKNLNCGKIYLIVSHGIFSAGFDELYKYFDCIYCTNSIRDIDDKNKAEWNVREVNFLKEDFIKQYKII